MYDEFDEEEVVSSNGTYLKPEQLVGHLLLIWATGYKEEYTTEYGTKDAVVVSVVDLDQPGTDGLPGLVSTGNLWFQGRLIRDLKPRIGRASPVLALMTMGIATKGKPPYEILLASGDPECKARGSEWMRRNQDFVPAGKPAAVAPARPAGPAAPVSAQPAPAQPFNQHPPAGNGSLMDRLRAEAAAKQAAQLPDPPF